MEWLGEVEDQANQCLSVSQEEVRYIRIVRTGGGGGGEGFLVMLRGFP